MANINVNIIDQRLDGIMKEIREQVRDELNINDDIRLKSISFVYLCTKTLLDLDHDRTFDCITDGGNDFGIDAIHMTEEVDGEFTVTLLQSKYDTKLSGDCNFPENGIVKLINAIKYIFDPYSNVAHMNNRLKVRVEEVRSMIRDGYIPQVRVIACNNGRKWKDEAQYIIDEANFGDQVTWEHVNHDVLIRILQKIKPVDEMLNLVGEALVEDMNFSRVCIGRMPAIELAHLMERHGEKLLERNIRRYLGLHGNRVNEGIRDTLFNDPDNFYFFNNGITMICDDFSYNALQNSDYKIKVNNLQIVNGGQTCMTIFKTKEEMERTGKNFPSTASVLVRIYKLPRDNEDIVLRITQATNSQNPVDLKDLRSNDEKQQQLEISVKEIGYHYRRKRMETPTKSTDITSGAAAEAILAVWRKRPHQAKFLTREHFGRLYDVIFTDDLNGPQVVIAVLLYRIAENHRRRPTEEDPMFVRYASCFIAMQMGKRLLKSMNIPLDSLDHRNYQTAKELVEKKGEDFFRHSTKDIDLALQDLYGNDYENKISLQQLSATFRRGDLIERLNNMALHD